MNLKEAIEKRVVFKTEYGTGASVLGGLLKRTVFKRQRYWLDGRKEEDDIVERALTLGPVNVVHRSKNPSMFGGDDYELTLTLFGLFAFSNDKEMLVKFKAGPSLGVLKTLLAVTPARLVAEAVDLDVAARTGMRINVTRLLQDLKSESDSEPNEEMSDEDDMDLN
jgi:hypothetical protein